jgi:hypothetical protein
MNLRKVSFGIIKRIGETTPPMLLFGAATLLLILGLLGLAEDGSESPRCDFGNIDCLIASHETLAAGLLGAQRCLQAGSHTAPPSKLLHAPSPQHRRQNARNCPNRFRIIVTT